ncbi:hypothetical protein EZ216_14625 [Ramlibacter humi]|uniref:Uncharacterized protein n=1 Tax=Ramlibacter humi TaxID=2530451 RepID=A0A4Z0BQ12_9BURK|nr:hypothetical protein EZ216_14625 [Ramlibacter humi]
MAAAMFACALAHTNIARQFERLSARFPRHEGLFHLLGEVEVVFGFWSLLTILGLALLGAPAVDYLESRQYTEPLFVFAIMVVAGSRPARRRAAASRSSPTRRIRPAWLCCAPASTTAPSAPAGCCWARWRPRRWR